MAALKLIEVNSAIKPYIRKFIAEKLSEIQSRKESLNKRQKKELEFFLRDYRKELAFSNQVDWLGKKVFGKYRIPFKTREKRVDLFYYKDSLFNITVNPIVGMKVWSNSNGLTYHRWMLLLLLLNLQINTGMLKKAAKTKSDYYFNAAIN